MANRVVRLALLLAVLGAVVVAATSAVQAQNAALPVIVSCQNPSRFDVNHDGVVNQWDMDQWVRVVHGSGDICQRDQLLGNCPAWVDIDGDGFITILDLDAIGSYIRNCLQPRNAVMPPW